MTEGPERSAAGPRSARDSGALADVDLSTHDWRALIEQLPLAVYIDRLDWWSSNIYTSRQIEAILGYTTEEWTAEDHLLLKVLHPDDRERVMAAHRRSCETGEPFRMEYRMISRDGRVVWFLDQATVVPGQPGRPGFHHGFLLDITERKQLEEALAESTEELGTQKRYFESLLEISPVAIVTTDLEDVVTSWNPAAERLFGYSAREAVGRKIDDLVARTAVLRAEAAAVTRDALHKGRVQAITRRTHKDGSLIDVELLASPVLLHGEPVGTYAIYHDVRELKRAEERYRALVEGLPLVTYVDEPNERAASIYVSPQIEALLGYTPDEWVADPELFVRRVHPDDRERVLAEHARAFAAGEPSWSSDYRLLARDGRTVWLHDEALIVRDEHGTPLYVQGFQVDVSERKAEEALRRSEAEVRRQKQYFESLVEISPTAVLTLDLEERVTSWNPAAERLFGYSKAEAVGQRVMDLTLRPEDRGERDALMQQVAATGSARMTTRRRRKDGSLVDVEVLVVALEADGERFGSYVIYHDISELLRRRQYLESLLELSPTAIVTMDLEGNVTSWNPAAESLFGYTRQEAIGRCVDDLVARSDEVRAEAVDAGRQAAKGEKVHLTTRRTRKDGTLVDVDVRAAPIVVGDEQVGMYSLYHDVSELLRARREAEAATAAKSAFLATMSHEIRTPLNAVIGMTELLLDTELTTAQLDLAHVVHRSGDALLDVINDILDFSKIEAGRLELEHRPLVLRDCVESALEMVGAAAAGKGLDVACLIDPEAPSAILGDSTRLRHILVNLLTNAVKFTERGEVVLTVEWRASAAEDESAHRHHLHFTVRDTGIGIPADRIDGLFESFSQVDASTTRRYGGTGLGLAISKRLCELMRGEMWVESEPGKGSAFHFTVAAEATSGPSLPPVAAELRGMRLLVVDDNAANREVVTRQARSWGMVPRETGSPTEALEWIRRGDPLDVAILDMQMPEMDGLTLAHEIRRYRDADALPLVMLTSLGRRADDREARGEFTAILTKPIKASQLYEVVTAAVGAQARRARRAREAEPDVIPGRRAQLRVLLAEDNAVNQQLALRMLGTLGYQADVAVNGLEALQALRLRPYDLVLMDVEMPEMDGLEAARRIHREWPGDERPRIVAMTANAMQGDREICLAAGMDDYLSKPIHLDELANALRRCAPRGPAPPQTARSASPPDRENGVLDPDALEQLHARAGDRDFVIELVDTFLREGPALVETLRGALQDADAQQLRRAAHTLKSNARVFGARELAALCQEVEAMARVGVLAGAAELAARIDDEYARVADALQAAGRELA